MNSKDIWTITCSIIASLGGVGAVICAIISFACDRITRRLDAEYEQRLNKELEEYKNNLERNKYITKSQFDREFQIYHQLSKAFFLMIVKLSSFTDDSGKLRKKNTEKLEVSVNEFKRLIEAMSEAQNVLYENIAFIPKDIFDQYDKIYSEANDLFWLFDSRLQNKLMNNDELETLFYDKDKEVVKEIEKEFYLVNDKLREYLSSLKIVE